MQHPQHELRAPDTNIQWNALELDSLEGCFIVGWGCWESDTGIHLAGKPPSVAKVKMYFVRSCLTDNPGFYVNLPRKQNRVK